MVLSDSFLRPVHSVPESASAADAARVLRDERVGSVLVLDGDGRAIGIVTDRDLALRIVGAQLDPTATPVVACMSRPLRTAQPGDSMREAARRMREHLVRRLPIVDGEGRPQGIVTADDLVQYLSSTIGMLSQAPLQGIENEGRGQEPRGSIFGKE